MTTAGELRIDVHVGSGSSRSLPDDADFRACGLELAEWFTDDEGLFALSLAGKA